MTEARRPLRVLQVEDSPDDADLVLREVRQGGFEVVCERVQTADALREALGRATWDLVLADWMMPMFSAPEALAVVQATRPDLPFIIVSGTVGEETAVAALKAGADDFMLKGSLWRLAPAIERAIRDAEARRERRRAEAALLASETRFRSLIDGSSDLISILAADGTHRYVSPSIERILGYAPDEQLGRRIYDLVHPEDVARVRQAVDTALAGGGLTGPMEYRVRHKDGSWRTMDAVGTNLLAVPSVGGIVVNARDVTERVRLEQELLQAQKLEALGKLAGGVAHDFNNLLTVIHANVGLLATDLPPGARVRRELDGLERAATRGQELVKNLLGFARREPLGMARCDLGEMIEDVVATLRHLLPENVVVKLTVARPLPAVLADGGSVEQILINLATNARDAMPQGGTLSIGVARCERDGRDAAAAGAPGSYVAVTVTDTGAGMDEQTLQHAAEPFFTTKPIGQGTGLGIPLVVGLMKQHGGRFGIASELGRGTTIELLFPAAQGAAGAVAAPGRAAEGARGGAETILVVEDEAELRDAACRVLTRFGYRTLAAADGAEALAAFRANPGAVDLIFTDLVMPQLGGAELLEQVKAERPGMRFLVASGYAGGDARGAALRAGVPFINKPWTLPELLQQVRRVLDSPAD